MSEDFRTMRRDPRCITVPIQRAMTHDREDDSSASITQLLIDWRTGDPDAFNRLLPLVYDELRVIARRQRRRSGSDTLNTTALVHEAYLKLVDHTRLRLNDRVHFFAVAARAMRQILVDHARRRFAQKRGAGHAEPLGDAAALNAEGSNVLAIDLALSKLEAFDARLGQLVELRVFGGLSVEEAAGMLEVSPRTVKRDWQKARAFLARELST